MSRCNWKIRVPSILLNISRRSSPIDWTVGLYTSPLTKSAATTLQIHVLTIPLHLSHQQRCSTGIESRVHDPSMKHTLFLTSSTPNLIVLGSNYLKGDQGCSNSIKWMKIKSIIHCFKHYSRKLRMRRSKMQDTLHVSRINVEGGTFLLR